MNKSDQEAIERGTFPEVTVNAAQNPAVPSSTVAKDILSDADLRVKTRELNRLFKEIQEYKEAHREQRIGYYDLSRGSILNAYREGDLTFDEAIDAIQATQSSEASSNLDDTVAAELLTDASESLAELIGLTVCAPLDDDCARCRAMKVNLRLIDTAAIRQREQGYGK